MPTSVPIVEPNVLKVAEVERVQYGRYAVVIATEVSTPRKYDVFSAAFPESFRVITVREAAYITRSQKLELFDALVECGLRGLELRLGLVVRRLRLLHVGRAGALQVPQRGVG